MGYPEKSALGPSLQLPPISTFAIQSGYALDQRHFNGLSAVAAAAAAVEPMAVSTGTTSSSGSSAGASPVAGVPAYLRPVEPQRSSSAPLLLPNSATPPGYPTQDKWSGYDSKELLERRGLDASQLKALSQMADRRGSSPMDYNSPSPQDSRDKLNGDRARAMADPEDRRMIHNVSERRRRNSIKDGFNELREHVPTLRRDRHSKIEILRRAVDHIEILARERDSMAAEIERLRSELKEARKTSST